MVALAALTALAWFYLVLRARAMDMGGISMAVAEISPWSMSDFVLTFLMWAVMMVGMMVPSAMPTTLIYGGIFRGAQAAGDAVAPTLIFVSGYLMAWSLFSAVATAVQWILESVALLSPMMVSTSPALGAGLLTMAGIYQLTPAKHACLSHCRSPVHFMSRHWRPGFSGAFQMGISHGFYCLGCCWALMLLLFVGGVMNLVWVAAIGFFVLVEKIPARGRAPSWLAGASMIVVGIVLLVRGM